MIITKRTRVDFPVRLDETFIVRENGKCVERWRHIAGPRKSNTDTTHERHDFLVEVLVPEWRDHA